MEEKKQKSAKAGGVYANSLVIPLIVTLVLLYTTIIVLVYNVNLATNDLSNVSQQFGACQHELTDLQTGAGILSETSITLTLMPLSDTGEVNVGSLSAYAKELIVDRRGQAVAARMHKLTQNEKALTYIDEAAGYASTCIEIQTHALALVRSVYTFPPLEAFSAIPEVALTEEELALSPEKRMELAHGLMLGSAYGRAKYYLNQSVKNCSAALESEFSEVSARCEKHVTDLRIALWVVNFTLIALLIVTFVFFYLWIVLPLHTYTRLITSDERLEKRGIIREIRLVASAYNSLLHRRNKLENILRSAAETDELTGLPNRYSLARNLLENSEKTDSMAVCLFDVNFLKRTNDTEGHLAGDKLIQTTATCIRECFGKPNENNCYRIGGDEFVAILRACTEEDARARIDHFTLALEHEKISVSVGYAYTAATEEGSFQILMDQADKQMYEQKKKAHGLEQ